MVTKFVRFGFFFCLWLPLITSTDMLPSSCPPQQLPYLHSFQSYRPNEDYHRIEVIFTLSDGFKIIEGISFIRSGSQPWFTTADPLQQPTDCQEQYAHFIAYTLGILNKGQRPFEYAADTAAYDAFLWQAWAAEAPFKNFLPFVRK